MMNFEFDFNLNHDITTRIKHHLYIKHLNFINK